MVPIYDKH